MKGFVVAADVGANGYLVIAQDVAVDVVQGSPIPPYGAVVTGGDAKLRGLVYCELAEVGDNVAAVIGGVVLLEFDCDVRLLLIGEITGDISAVGIIRNLRGVRCKVNVRIGFNSCG